MTSAHTVGSLYFVFDLLKRITTYMYEAVRFYSDTVHRYGCTFW